MAGQAIQAVQFQVLVEIRQAQEALQRALLHVRHVFEAHVIGHQRLHLLGLVARESQAASECRGPARTPSSTWPSKRMRSATRKVGGLPTSCSSAPSASVGVGWSRFSSSSRVCDPDVAFGMVFGRLLDAFHGGHFGQHDGQQAALVQQFEAAAGAAFGEDARPARRGRARRRPCAMSAVAARMAVEGGGFDRETEPRGEADGAQQAQMVLAEARVGIADGAHQRGSEIGAASNVIQHCAGLGIHQQAVDGEIAAQHVLARVALEVDGRRGGGRRRNPGRCGRWPLPPGRSRRAPAPRRNARPRGRSSGTESMMRSGRASVATSKSLGVIAQQQVADAAAHQVGLMAWPAARRHRARQYSGYPSALPAYANMRAADVPAADSAVYPRC